MRYSKFIDESVLQYLRSQASPMVEIRGWSQIGECQGLETPDALLFLRDLWNQVRPRLNSILDQREKDRQFIDQRTWACFELNRKLGIDFTDPDYHTILGQEDDQGRCVVGPLRTDYARPDSRMPPQRVAPIPPHLQGSHVTLFGPPDDPKLAINAMNAFHRKLPGEPPVVETLLQRGLNRSPPDRPKWGADDEDSKTPLRKSLVQSGLHLRECFNQTLEYVDPQTQKKYQLAKSHLIQPIKRFPGLALPCLFLLDHGEPIPLHLYDFALHLFHHWHLPQALSFYVPKIETEEEAQYLHELIKTAEELIKKIHPEYQLGTVRVLLVIENPRAIFRVHEIMDSLYPYFAGASLGWHDYLASTARLFKKDSNYRIPVKADPNIVIRCIKASHELLQSVVGSRGGICIGGMYGVLPTDSDPTSDSFQLSLLGFFKDVITQLKRGLDGFWIAHPDFLRIGLAGIEAFRLHREGNSQPLETLLCSSLRPEFHREILEFLKGPDVPGLSLDDPLFPRFLMVAHSKESAFVPNHDLEEVRYNVFQTLQYLADWLTGNGCVALPAQLNQISVRVMDDLATAERSRWEVWHEQIHGRVSPEDLVQIAHEELRFIQKNRSDTHKKVQVKWNDTTAKWYPVALEIMLQLMTSPEPPEFASQLLLPFTLPAIRESRTPLIEARKIAPENFKLPKTIRRLHRAFSACGSRRFAMAYQNQIIPSESALKKIFAQFDLNDIHEAASYHGDIGESKATLDAHAAQEQSGAIRSTEEVRGLLRQKGGEYLRRFGFKFLTFAQGKTGEELLKEIETRLNRTPESELQSARDALYRITLKRLRETSGDPSLPDELQLDSILTRLLDDYKIPSLQLAIADSENRFQSRAYRTTDEKRFQLASLSKTLAASFSIEFLAQHQIDLDTSVQSVLNQLHAPFRVDPRICIRHLLNHQALNLHYVRGIPIDQGFPTMEQLLVSPQGFGYEPIQLAVEPGNGFQYSGGGFIVLQYLIEKLSKKDVETATRPLLDQMGLQEISFDSSPQPDWATGYIQSDQPRTGGPLRFPAFAAGAVGTARAYLRYLIELGAAYAPVLATESRPSWIHHSTAVQMLATQDRSSQNFMGCNIGLGVFVAEAGQNRIAVHQGANDGFRALSLYCFDGPDRGKGLVLLCNADDPGVAFLSKVSQILLRHLEMTGIDFDRWVDPRPQLQSKLNSVKPEERVNRGYKEFLFDAFLRTRPEPILFHGPPDPLSALSVLTGASLIDVSNERFARADNLVSEYLPHFDPALYGQQGKIMDSWESVRHNFRPATGPHDWAKFRLRKKSRSRFVSLSTQYHLGNHSPWVSIEGQLGDGDPFVILPKTAIEGHASCDIDLEHLTPEFDQVIVRIYPDGGLSRLRLFDELLPQAQREAFLPFGKHKSFPFAQKIPHPKKPLMPSYPMNAEIIQKNWSRLSPGQWVDVASAAFGGKILHASNEHYGPANQILSPYPPLHMFDGSESARSRKKDHSEFVEIEFFRPFKIEKILLNFFWFRNNSPHEIQIEGQYENVSDWVPLTPKFFAKPYAGNSLLIPLTSPTHLGMDSATDRPLIQKIRFVAFPDGGLNRLEAWARVPTESF